MKEIKQGISNEQYHSSNGYYSSSALKLLLKEPELFYRIYIKKEKKKDSDAEHFDIGTAIHTKILEPEKFDQTVTFYTGVKRGKVWEEFKENNKGKIILGDLAKAKIDTMFESIHKSSGIDYLRGGKSELSLFTELQGVKIKVRADHIHEDKFISDLKSMSGLVTEKAFMAQCARYGYDLSAALYLDAFSQYESTLVEYEFYFVVSSTEFEDTKIFRATKEFLDAGREKYKEAIRLLKMYEENGWNFQKTVIDLKPYDAQSLYEF